MQQPPKPRKKRESKTPAVGVTKGKSMRINNATWDIFCELVPKKYRTKTVTSLIDSFNAAHTSPQESQ